jgi:hypothetical protein
VLILKSISYWEYVEVVIGVQHVTMYACMYVTCHNVCMYVCDMSQCMHACVCVCVCVCLFCQVISSVGQPLETAPNYHGVSGQF